MNALRAGAGGYAPRLRERRDSEALLREPGWWAVSLRCGVFHVTGATRAGVLMSCMAVVLCP